MNEAHDILLIRETMNNSQFNLVASSRFILYPATLLCLLSFIAIAINSFGYHYPGNNYVSPNTYAVVLWLVLIYSGLAIQYGRNSWPARIAKEIILFYLVLAVIALTINAVQYTPFPTIDKKIIAIEASLHLDLVAILSWTYTKPLMKQLLEFSYNSLPYQVILFPLIIIVTRRWHYIREYYFLLLISTLIGFSFYYFFPTTAPASNIVSHYFTPSQHATGLKFMQIHQHIPPTTLDGGMISLPSFHFIWAWYSLYILRGWPLGLIIMLPVNLLLASSCVLLGWHYLLDILGSVIVIMMAHTLYYFSFTYAHKRNLMHQGTVF